MDLEGSIQIKLDCKNKNKLKVDCISSRPVNAVSVFENKPIAETLETLPMLFSVCSTAQARAAFLAWNDAIGFNLPEVINDSQKILLLLETLREHIWQIFINWPQLIDKESNIKILAQFSQLLIKIRNELFVEGKGFTPSLVCQVKKPLLLHYIQQLKDMLAEYIFKLDVNNWLDKIENKGLRQWTSTFNTPATKMLEFIIDKNWQSLGATEIAPLPLLKNHQWKTFFSDQQQWALIKTPTWHQQCFQTSVFTRCLKNKRFKILTEFKAQGLLARYLSRLLELASIPNQLNELVDGLEPGDFKLEFMQTSSGGGLSVVDAARGSLVHWLKIHNGLIKQYRILAPTEWNFHPNGVAVKGLETLSAENEVILRQQAKLWLNAIDPCVNYQLEILNWS
jgi:uptake hydrogenase large subunit